MKLNKTLQKIRYIRSYLRGRYAQVMRHYVQPKFKYRFVWNSYNGKKILSISQGSELLIHLIKSGKPFMAGRFGTTECRAVVRKLEIDLGFKTEFGDRLDGICTHSGFFPHDEKMLHQYGEQMFKYYAGADLIGIMNVLGEDFVIRNFCENAQLTRLEVFDPLSWSHSLEGKKVLVIHPMADTIRKQYREKQELIYANTNILPKFNLQTVKAVQTLAGEIDERFPTWFHALNYMQKEIEEKDFDIALIGAGAYGFPLGVHVKNMGKQAIHMGGSLQLLFGIKGSRWDNNESYKKYFNEAWVRPDKSEIIKNHHSVEESCYW